MHSLQHHIALAIRAYNGTSFSPEKRGANILTQFEQQLAEDLQVVPEHYHAKYIAKFENHLTGWLASKSRCVSPMIAGPANFPVARMRKFSQWEDNRYAAFMHWRKRLCDSFSRQARKKNAGSELQQAVDKLAALKKNHDIMKSCNAIIRAHKGQDSCIPECVAAGLTEDIVRQLLKPAYSYMKKGFQTFELSNSSREISRMEDRVKMLQTKEQAKTAIAEGAQVPEITVNGATIRKDFSDDRLKVIFDGKPAANVIAALKSRGFRWSPFLKAWCRKLTNEAFYAAQNICERELTPVPAQQVPQGWDVL